MILFFLNSNVTRESPRIKKEPWMSLFFIIFIRNSIEMPIQGYVYCFHLRVDLAVGIEYDIRLLPTHSTKSRTNVAFLFGFV